ncbi:UNVERIFIED_CONTAM: hypothetical protein Sradi_6849600, partial [Sesamum radiatum]
AADGTDEPVTDEPVVHDGDGGGDSEKNEEIPSKFNMIDFMRLAKRVLDEDDRESMAILEALLTKWQGKFGHSASPIELGLKPVTEHVVTPFRPPPLRIARRFPRLPTPEQQQQILTTSLRQAIGPKELLDTNLVRENLQVTSAAGISPPVFTPLPTESEFGTEATQSEAAVQPELCTQPAKTPDESEFFVGNVRIDMRKDDPIADAFLQSSRKTLHYISPMKQRGEIIIRPTLRMMEQGSKRWRATAVGYFLGRKPYFPQLEAFAKSNWKGLVHVSANSAGFYFFRFQTIAYMEEVIEGGPWLFQGQPIVLQSWQQGMSLRRQKHTTVPVWIKLKHLPMEYWTEDGLSAVASGVGVPLYVDRVTKECSRLDYARVCVMLDYSTVLPRHVVLISPVLHEGKEIPIKVDIEYDWLPQRCRKCCSLGHSVVNCPEEKRRNVSAPAMVFVRKAQGNNVEVSKGGDEVASQLHEMADEVDADLRETWHEIQPHNFLLITQLSIHHSNQGKIVRMFRVISLRKGKELFSTTHLRY